VTFPLHSAGPFTDDLSTIPGSILNDWKAQWPNAVDGASGGTYAPSSAITIGGSGLALTGPTNRTGAAATTQWRRDKTTIVDAAATVTVAADSYYALTNLTADRIITFSAAGAVLGDRIRVTTSDAVLVASGKKLTMKNHDATQMAVGSTSLGGFFEAEFDGTDWQPSAFSNYTGIIIS